jgi:UDP-N-acetyl-D-galactosamine dehydrogenase
MQSMFDVLETPEAAPRPTLVESPEPGAEAGQETVAVVGLGYVGIPVAVAFGRRRPTIGYDRAARKVESLRSLVDPTGELTTEDLRQARQLRATVDATDLERAEFVIIAVPTPVNAARQPDFEPLESASYTVGKYLRSGATVIYESTVYPGATEEICVPILERASGMRWRHDFHVGYSPERINPGDRDHAFHRIVKVVAGDDAQTLEKVARLYESVVDAGVYRAPSIRVAEAAKVIENTQRDLNIAFVNELSIIFEKLGIDTGEVLAAASTKWNFLPFKPGLVGGHCIGVDPYYLTHRAERAGYHPQMILAGRRINDGMGAYIAHKIVQQLIHSGRNVRGARVNILGITFKEDVPDIRNSKVIDVIRELREFGIEVQAHDPAADPEAVLEEYDLRLRAWEDLPTADALVLAVPHRRFRELAAPAYLQKIVRHGCFVDLKAVFDPEPFRREGVRVWRL